MSNSSKSYFRHDVHATDDDKIQKLISDDGLGKKGYFFFFALCELYARNCRGTYSNVVTLHRNTLRKYWATHANKLSNVLTVLQQCGLIAWTVSGHSYSISIPSLEKYIGRYSKKGPNKIKENQIKSNKIKENEIKDSNSSSSAVCNENLTPAHIADAWNKALGIKINKPYHSHTFGSGVLHETYINAIKHPPLNKIEGWVELFERCKKSQFLMTKMNNFNLYWILSGDNLVKILAGQFDMQEWEEEFDFDKEMENENS